MRPMLQLFKEQLTNQIPALKKTLALATDGEAFAYWYFRHILTETDQSAKDQICEGGGDLGIDAITVTEDEVVFYQFKNPQNTKKGIEAGDLDKLISGLTVIIARAFDKIANAELKARISDVYSVTPNRYKIMIVSSGQGDLDVESKRKLDSFCETHGGPSKNLFSWKYEKLENIHDLFYASNLPTLEGKVSIEVGQPFLEKIGNHEVYLFSLTGVALANLFEAHGEQLLQQNVRMFEGDNSTNLAIEKTASSTEANDFFYYNNGVTIICDAAQYNPFNKQLEMTRPQVVNGGQTVRILHKCLKKNSLKLETRVATRVSTTGGDKDFASNVAINLNNQTRVNNAFLRSNDPRVVQLYHSLASIGWHLERRDGEIEALTATERTNLENRFGSPLADHTIPLKEGMQAFVSTIYDDPQLAKKDPNKIFIDMDGGHFSKILEAGLSAEAFLNAYKLFKIVGDYVEEFKKCKRRRHVTDNDRKGAYATLLGQPIVDSFYDELDESIPQSTIFLTALLYFKEVKVGKMTLPNLVTNLSAKKDPSIIPGVLTDLLSTGAKGSNGKSWPTLLKSGTFFNEAKKAVMAKKENPKNN